MRGRFRARRDGWTDLVRQSQIQLTDYRDAKANQLLSSADLC